MIEARNIGMSFGERVLLQEVSFQIGDDQKLCLAGPNGAGKSTLYSILAGELTPDSGQVIRSGGLRIGWLRQQAQFPPSVTVFDAAQLAFKPLIEKADALHHLREAMGHRDLTDEETHQLDDWEDALFRGGYYSLESETRIVLDGLGFSRENQDKELRELSGGWQMRVALAQVLLGKPELMLLDEPTNHLDLESIMWLESYLKSQKGSLLLVCHDRRFVDKVCEGVLDLRQGKLREYPLPFARYEEERALRLAQQRQSAAKAQGEIDRLAKFIDRFKAKASKASLARSATKRMNRIEVEEIESDGPSMRLRFPPTDYAGNCAFRAELIAKSFGEKVIFTQGDFTISAGDKTALVGPNGAGKSTLMKLMAGELQTDAGELVRGLNARIGYYAQYVEPSPEELKKSILNLLVDANLQVTPNQVRSALGSMMFSGDDVHKQIQVLSGGERARVRLAQLLLSPSNVLLLDEPTNHLDLRSQDLLLDALESYQGTVVFVSHDRDFCEALATRVLRVDSGRIVEYPGDYAYYSHKLELDIEKEEAVVPGKKKSATQASASSSSSVSSSTSSSKGRKEIEKIQRSREKRESEVSIRIDALEKRNVSLDTELVQESGKGGKEALEACRKLVEEKEKNLKELETLYVEWVEISGTEVESN